MSKKIRILLLTLCMLGLAGCTEDDPNVEFTWALGTSSPEDTVTQVYAQAFADQVHTLSGGKMVIDIFPNSTVGNDNELLESCEEGDIPFVVQNTAPQTNYMREMAVFDLPCVFSDIEKAREAVDNDAFHSAIEKVYKNGGYHLLGIADQGFRVMTTNKNVQSFADFKGQKIRTMENTYHLEFWQSLNANPTPMAFSEVYIGLQQNTIDAQENPVEVIVSGKLYEQQDYVVETNHLPHYIMLFMNDDLFEGLTAEQQQILVRAAQSATETAREQADQRVQDRLNAIQESGTQIITPSEELYDQMKDASRNIYDEIREEVGDTLVDLYTQSTHKENRE